MSLLADLDGDAGAADRYGDAYDELPDGIKADLTHEQWLWLSDGEKVDLVTRSCEPDAYEDS